MVNLFHKNQAGGSCGIRGSIGPRSSVLMPLASLAVRVGLASAGFARVPLGPLPVLRIGVGGIGILLAA